MGAQARLLSEGQRLHLQHGPIDLIIGAEGARTRAFEAAFARFESVLDELARELPLLQTALGPRSDRARGQIARKMQSACRAMGYRGFLTPMAAVAGAVADTVLEAMCAAADLTRAYVNNGGDVAVHLAPGARFRMAMADHQGRGLGLIDIGHEDPVRGIATSGRHGRSLSLGIADSVTVLARTAAAADVAATLVANAVDLPGHPAVRRRPACEIDAASDLAEQPVVTGCGALTDRETRAALASGAAFAQGLVETARLSGACLFLNGQSSRVGQTRLQAQEQDLIAYA